LSWRQARLPIDYPRTNQFPEWFTVEADRAYEVSDVSAGSERRHTGEQLAAGAEIEPAPNVETRLIVTPESR